MSPQSKKEYMEAIVKRYKMASKPQKQLILDEFCAATHYHRKHAIRLLRGFKRFTNPQPKPRGPKPTYDSPELLKALKKIWLASNQPCATRLKALLPLWLPSYRPVSGKLSPQIQEALKTISSATINRLLKPVRVQYNKRGRATTKPGTLLRKQIPLKTNQWDESRPGFLEADTVAHCGDSLAGQFAFTVDCVDIATGWTEQRAVWGKGETGVLEQLRHIEHSLPFPLLGFDSDNGSEFLNHHLLRHFTQRKKPVQFTRSRAYHKDDNAHIEQKNWTHVRQWLGYHRFDNPEVVPLLNDLYTQQWRLFHNFFLPSVKLLAKERIASKTIRRYDSPKTPYHRVLESPLVSPAIKRKLTALFKTLNPFDLRAAMEKKLEKIFLCQSHKKSTSALKPR
jgi:hypothetical protein